jgi:hypothetical protein
LTREPDSPPPDGNGYQMAGACEIENRNLRYFDFYCFMSLSDFMEWIEKNDGSEPSMSYSGAL